MQYKKTVTSSPPAENGSVVASFHRLQFGFDATFTLKTIPNCSLSLVTDCDVKLKLADYWPISEELEITWPSHRAHIMQAELESSACSGRPNHSYQRIPRSTDIDILLNTPMAPKTTKSAHAPIPQ